MESSFWTIPGAFAVFALIQAAVGEYGVVSYLVTQNQHDIGLRVALGEQWVDIIRMVMGQGMGLAAWGIEAGRAGALALTQFMGSMLFGVSARDRMTFSIFAVFLCHIAMVATYVPALRATTVDPIKALQEE